jgi:multiple sugar transport system substrate-binding protein
MNKMSLLLVLAVIVGTLMASCAPPAPTTVEVVKTVVVTQVVEGKPVEKVITVTPVPTKDTSKDPVNLRFTTWTANETQLKLLNDIAAEYKVKNPNVTVKFESLAFDDYATKLSVMLAGGDPPDMGWVVENVAASWIKAGVLDDVSAKLKAYPNYDFEDFSKGPLGFWVRDAAVYAVPFSTSPFFVIYNADLFKAAGIDTPEEMIAKKTWTWDNFAQAAKTITDKGEKGTYGYAGIEGGNMYAANLWTIMTPYIWSFGGDLWTADYATCKLNSAESVKALRFVQKMVVDDKSTVPPGDTVSFVNGKVGMTFGQVSRIGPLKDGKFKWGIAPMPTGPAGYKPTIGQAAIGVFRVGNAKNKAAAQDFLAFITTKENVTKMAQFWPPARKSVLATDAVAKNYPTVNPASFQAAVTDSINNGAVVPSHPDFAKVDLALHPFFDKIWTKDANVQDLMDQACKAGVALFKK